MSTADVSQIIQRIDQLPPLPEVAGHLLELLGDPNSTIKEVNDVMSHDPALTADIMRLVNSSYCGLRNRVTSLSRALALLGFRTVKNIVLAAAAAGVFESAETSPLFRAREFVRHSVAQAVVCRFLAGYRGCCDPEEAFTVGLLHDIGKLVTDIHFHDVYATIAGLAERLHLSYSEAETHVWEHHHGRIGSLLASSWNIPSALAEAIEHHHSLEGAVHKEMVALNILADYFTSVKRMASPNHFGRPTLSRDAWGHLNLDAQAFPQVMSELQKEITLASDLYMLADIAY